MLHPTPSFQQELRGGLISEEEEKKRCFVFSLLRLHSDFVAVCLVMMELCSVLVSPVIDTARLRI